MIWGSIPQSKDSLSEVPVLGFRARALKNQEGSQRGAETLINAWTLFCMDGPDLLKCTNKHG